MMPNAIANIIPNAINTLLIRIKGVTNAATVIM